jgi:hypothetical protein
MFHRLIVVPLVVVLMACAAVALAACGSTTSTVTETAAAATSSVPAAHPQAVDPTAGQQAAVVTPSDPLGDVHAHAPPLSVIRRELREEYVYVKTNNATYIDPLRYVNHWERTDQGVDATLPVGAPILAPCTVKILGIEPDWYAGQPLIYFELLEGPYARQVQYVAEQITDLAPAGSILQQGQVIARYAPAGTAIEYGWSTLNGITLARATTGYEEGEITPAGQSMRKWLNSLGAGAGPWPPA